jgi:hypothetical protein
VVDAPALVLAALFAAVGAARRVNGPARQYFFCLESGFYHHRTLWREQKCSPYSPLVSIPSPFSIVFSPG